MLTLLEVLLASVVAQSDPKGPMLIADAERSVDAAKSDFSMFGLANVRDYALEGEWDLVECNGSSIFMPVGSGDHGVVVTTKLGGVFVRQVASNGTVVDDQSSLVIQREVRWVPSEDLLQGGGYCPHGTLTVYPASSIISVSTSGGCWTMGTTPAGCVSAKCNALQGACNLSVNTPAGTDDYTDDCGGDLKFVWCVGGSLAVCH